ncbi:Laminin G sub domain 2 [Halosimplex carlsbadense 2-9-1]|uniref:dolichyl-phosphooligosaccharide-protein glycotransferase n=1 Tax=Halosimplex carlsbadense 2-9-1 TaxID=797114 RepID=M0CKC9_9EURY|nr:LamG-like jellyroll fold domain-containing protein [Halosimplex carlsbadense]ELZ23696.1 Laminin G sub domain 2 [Halosimplex carlsbadense 2-9-1]
MADARTETEALLADKSHLESQLEEVLAVDESTESWAFDDVSLDSGAFGELVSRGIVEEVNGEYTLADPKAVRQALDGDGSVSSDDEQSASFTESLSVEFDRVAVAGLLGALALVVVFRVLPLQSVFRGGDVVLSGNDPYYYRYLVHELLAVSSNPFDLSVLSSLPSGVAHGEPLMLVSMWWVSALLGGESAVDGVLAWFPVVSAVVTALLVYALTVRVTDDKRVGIAAVALLAVTPGHAFRTGLGFADHHAFDYPWLALTVLAAVSVVGRDILERRTWAWVGALAVGVAGQMLAWDAGPLLLVPLGLFALGLVPSVLRDGGSPLRAGRPLLAGVSMGTFVAVLAHISLGWHTPAVIVAPVLLSVGIAGLLVLGEGARRAEVSSRLVVGVSVVGLVLGIVALWSLVPVFATELERGMDFLLTTEGIAETTSIVSGDLGTIIGPIFLFGFGLFLALGHMCWALWMSYRRHAPAWLLITVYGWYFLLLSAIQVRFAGQLALFAALFGGLGFVHLAAWVDLASVPTPFVDNRLADGPRVVGSSGDEFSSAGELVRPNRRQLLHLGVLGFGAGSLGGLLTPIRHSQLVIDDSMYEAAKFMREHSKEQGWDYPKNYVFSQWGRNRVYNWFVNGESRGYGYAQSNFQDFVTSGNSAEWYEQLRNRAGFITIEESDPSATTEFGELYDQLWSDTFGIDTENYRAVWMNSTDSLRVFTPVSGALVTGPAPKNRTLNIEVTAEIGQKSQSIAIERHTGDQGIYQAVVPLPGIYQVNGNRLSVSEDDVQQGSVISGFSGNGYAYWSFNEGSGEWAYDRVGGHHGRIHEAEWTNRGRSEFALSFSGKNSSDFVESPVTSLQTFTISLWAKPAALDVSEDNDFRDIIRTPTGRIMVFEQSGKISFRLPGVDDGRLTGRGIQTNEWQHIAMTYDGSVRTIYINNERKARDRVSVGKLDWGGTLRLGNQFSTPSGHGYAGLLDEVRIHNRVLSDEELTNLRK